MDANGRPNEHNVGVACKEETTAYSYLVHCGNDSNEEKRRSSMLPDARRMLSLFKEKNVTLQHRTLF